MSRIQHELHKLGLSRYADYLKTRHWRRFRDAMLFGEPQCCGCVVFKATELHHISYELLGRETPGCVIGLCSGCHRAIHRELDAKFYRIGDTAKRVRHTCDVVQAAVGREWREMRARWQNHCQTVQWNSVEQRTEQGRYRQRCEQADTIREKRKAKQKQTDRDRMAGYVAHRCDRCRREVLRGSKNGSLSPCQCGGYMRKLNPIAPDRAHERQEIS